MNEKTRWAESQKARRTRLLQSLRARVRLGLEREQVGDRHVVAIAEMLAPVLHRSLGFEIDFCSKAAAVSSVCTASLSNGF